MCVGFTLILQYIALYYAVYYHIICTYFTYAITHEIELATCTMLILCMLHEHYVPDTLLAVLACVLY